MTLDCTSYLIFTFETGINGYVRGLIYCLGLAYCFLGLSAITARFFIGMENIVQHTREVTVTEPGAGRRVVKRTNVWNYVVADITLLAFGTSFPQISLSTIDACMNLGSLYAGGVGPGTLVGSAACDLFLIHALCIIIPKRGALKKVLDRNVWVVELVWSLWAYIWLYIILLVWTPQVITIWEAAMTVLQFFILVLHAYAQDRGWPFIAVSILDQKKRESWIASEPTSSTEFLNPHSHPLEQSFDPENSTDAPSCCQTPSTPHGHLLGSQIRSGLIVDGRQKEAIQEAISTAERRGCSYIMRLWKRQFSNVLTLNHMCCQNDEKSSKGFLFLYEVLAFPWKFLFAFVPPESLCHGWPTFLSSLFFITGISYLVTKLTNLIGCVTGVSAYVIALTVLATGTSWPDLAASMIAARRQSTADSAIANITCSNSVNIFIGIGVPWVISSVYNRVVLHEELRVPSLQLGFILSVYFITSILCVAVLVARRYYLGGELGGPRKWAWASCGFILLLWVVFLVLACLRIYSII